ncbi:hypothetical protein PMAYCL1PPCAC_27837, partial [Pristionchus mayeri]
MEANKNVAQASVKNKKKKRQKLSHRCALCGERTLSWNFAPMDTSRIQTFYDNLIDLTPEELDIAESLANTKRRVAVCKRHINEKQHKARVQVKSTTTCSECGIK